MKLQSFVITLSQEDLDVIAVAAEVLEMSHPDPIGVIEAILGMVVNGELGVVDVDEDETDEDEQAYQDFLEDSE